MTVDSSFSSSSYTLFVALDCDLQPRLSWLPFDFFRQSPTCSSSGSIRMPTEQLSTETDPEVTFTAYSDATGGEVVIGGEATEETEETVRRVSSSIGARDMQRRIYTYGSNCSYCIMQ